VAGSPSTSSTRSISSSSSQIASSAKSARSTRITVNPRLIRTKDAARYLGVSPWKIRQLVLAGQLSFVDDGDGSPWRFDVQDLDAYIARQKQSFAV
jgi:excisionase family DNA binding protein